MAEVSQEHFEAIQAAIQQGSMPAGLTPVLVHAVKTGLCATLDDVAANLRSLDFGSATPVLAMLVPTLLAAAKGWVMNFQYPPAPKPPYPYPPQPPVPPVPYPPQPGPAPYYPPQPQPQPAPFPPQPQPPAPPQPPPAPYYPPPPRTNGVDINAK